MKRITITVTDSDYIIIKRLLKAGKFSTTSEVLRAALRKTN